jgi:hypothetical protein
MVDVIKPNSMIIAENKAGFLLENPGVVVSS